MKFWIIIFFLFLFGVSIIGILFQESPNKEVNQNNSIVFETPPMLSNRSLILSNIKINIIKPATDYEKLHTFILNDDTNNNSYIASGENMYICTHYAYNLALNLSNAGFNAGVAVKTAKWHDKGTGHVMTWCALDNTTTYIIEPQNDCIITSKEYNNTIDKEIYIVRYESLKCGERKMNEMYKRR